MQDLDVLQTELARRELARRSYAEYLPFVHGGMGGYTPAPRLPDGGRSLSGEGGGTESWIRTAMSEFLAQSVQSFILAETGHAYDILLIATPPQHGKSMTITETLPSWYMGRYPRHRVIIGSYNDDTAERFARRNKEKVTQYGKALFGQSIGQINRSTEFELENGVGRLISRGVLGGITGNPANFVILDDLIKNRQEADSPTYRKRLWEEWQNSIKSRLAAGAKVILIMTPWHEDDLRARLLASESNISYLRLPVEAEEGDPLGRRPGEALCPELGKGARWLADFKESYVNDAEGGSRAWSALYQCNPRVEGGNLVRRDWWKYYDPKQISTFGAGVISVDASFKGGADNDPVSIQVWGKRWQNYYLRYCLNKRMDFPATLAAIRSVRVLYPEVRAVLIEDKANGSAIIQTLQQEMFCIPVNPLGGKEARLNAVSPAIESGHVFLPDDAPWVSEYVDQFCAFPQGANDDMVDSTSQALTYLFRLNGALTADPADAEVDRELRVQREEQTFLNGEKMFDVYKSVSVY